MKTFLPLLLVVLTFWGILDASFITFEKLSGSLPPCTIQFKCGEVLNSKWASVGPIPLSAIGAVFYTIFFIIALCFFFEKKEIQLPGFKIRTEQALAIQGFFGAGFSLYLIYIMGVVLKAWCLYCLFSASICLLLFATASTAYFLTRLEKEQNDEMHL